jgi:PKD repeat protein
MSRLTARVATCACLLLAAALPAFAGTVSLAWDPVPNSGVAGYMVHYGTSYGSYPNRIDAGNTTTFTVPGLADTGIYYFVVTAYDGSRTESAFSNSVAKSAAASPPSRIAPFSADTVSGTAPLSVNFTSYYAGTITAYAWNFGDGTSSSAANPSKAYTSPGVYSVTLTVTGPGGTDIQSRSNLIKIAASVAEPAPVRTAALTASAISGIEPLPVDFSSYYTGKIDSYAWTFGDGTSSSESNPSKMFTAPGVYSVGLTVTGPGGSDVQTKTNLIRVLPVPSTFMSRIGMAVDAHAATGTNSNLNGVLEPGETALLEPIWRNQTAAPVALSATATILPGLPGVNLNLPTANASFGSINPGTAANCQVITGVCYQMAVAIPPTRPAVHWDAHITETLSNGIAFSSPVHIGHSFMDVSENDPSYPHIEALLHNNVAAAFEDGTFRPWAASTHLDMVMFMARGLVAPVGDGAVPDSGMAGKLAYSCMPGGKSLLRDVSISSQVCKYAHFLIAKGVNIEFECSPKRLCIARDNTRAAMAVILAGSVAGGNTQVPMSGTYSDSGAVRSYDCSVSGGSHFTDVLATDPFCRHVNYLWARDIISGNNGGPYGPSSIVTRAELARSLVNGLSLKLY